MPRLGCMVTIPHPFLEDVRFVVYGSAHGPRWYRIDGDRWERLLHTPIGA